MEIETPDADTDGDYFYYFITYIGIFKYWCFGDCGY